MSRMLSQLLLSSLLFVAGTGVAFGQSSTSSDVLKRGEYLTRAADCEACHTVPGGEPYVGGRAFTLPFGVIFSPNITPDKATGIGDWNDDEFVRALHQGIGKDGEHLYPAFPYASYTAMSREDALAIKAYLFSLPAVAHPNVPLGLAFPFNQRWGMALWNIVNLTDKRFVPDPEQSTDWNRGNYLANALGHCGECHTPRTLSFGLDSSRPFAGAPIEGWHAYNLTSDADHGLGKWTDAQLESYLSTGHAQDRGAAAGPMEEVVRLSLSHLNKDDVHSLGVYLRSLAPQSSKADPVVNANPPALQETSYIPTDTKTSLGKTVFEGSCASCHGWDGSGMQTPYADLRGNGAASDPKATNLIQVVLNGASVNTSAGLMKMPAFKGSLSDTDIAAVATYVVNRFGGQGAIVSPKDVADARIGQVPIDFKPIVEAAGVIALLILLVIAVWLGIRWINRHAAKPQL